jgi:lipopolysaccharide export system protein LptA
MKKYRQYLFVVLLGLYSVSLLSQTTLSVVGEDSRSARDICKHCVLLTGNVKIRHKGTKILCDKAIWNRQDQNVDATGNVRIFKKDSEHPLRGDKLFYNSKTFLAELRDNVIYDDGKVSFTTEKFDYNTKTEEGYYFDGGIVKDSSTTLVSQRGYVYKNNDFLVKDDVTITTTDYLVIADSIKYNSDSEIVYILAPTTLHSDSTVLYAEGGYYNTRVKYAFLTDNASVEDESYYLSGDTLIFDELNDIAEGFGNVLMNDTVQMLILKGNRLYHDGLEESSFVTDSAQMLLYSGFDTLFAHADTFRNFTDTAEIQYITGYNNVRFFRLDVQGKCDSLVYSMEDSIVSMYFDPMIWAIFNQMEGEVIKIHTTNNRISHIEMVDDAFVVSREDSIRFNQIKGKTITGYLQNNDLRKIYVNGNAESIYYTREEQSLVGFNQTRSSYLTIMLRDGLVRRMSLTPSTSGTFFSVESRPHNEQFLRGFQWRSDIRPYSPLDIFRKIKE